MKGHMDCFFAPPCMLLPNRAPCRSRPLPESCAQASYACLSGSNSVFHTSARPASTPLYSELPGPLLKMANPRQPALKHPSAAASTATDCLLTALVLSAGAPGAAPSAVRQTIWRRLYAATAAASPVQYVCATLLKAALYTLLHSAVLNTNEHGGAPSGLKSTTKACAPAICEVSCVISACSWLTGSGRAAWPTGLAAGGMAARRGLLLVVTPYRSKVTHKEYVRELRGAGEGWSGQGDPLVGPPW